MEFTSSSAGGTVCAAPDGIGIAGGEGEEIRTTLRCPERVCEREKESTNLS